MIPAAVWNIMHRLHTVGHEVYLVGGSVRDLLMGNTPFDYDLTTSALPETVVALFPKTRTEGILYGTVTVVNAGVSVEVTTMRTEADYRDGRRPEQIDFTNSILEDLRRRDFTVNAMAFDGSVLYDLFGGTADIRSGIIRTVGNPAARFQEDGLRLLRAVRMSCVLNFTLHPRTFDAIVTSVKMIRNVAPQRVRPELEAILLSSHPDKGCAMLARTGLLNGLAFTDQNREEFLSREYWAPLCRLPVDLAARLAMFCLLIFGKDFSSAAGKADNWTEYMVSLLGKYAFSKKQIQQARTWILEINHLPYRNTVDLRRLLHRVGKDHAQIAAAFLSEAAVFLDLNEIYGAQWGKQIQTMIENGECTDVSELAVDGKDLAVLGIPEGPQVGAMLEYLLERILCEPELNTKPHLVELICERMQHED